MKHKLKYRDKRVYYRCWHCDKQLFDVSDIPFDRNHHWLETDNGKSEMLDTAVGRGCKLRHIIKHYKWRVRHYLEYEAPALQQRLFKPVKVFRKHRLNLILLLQIVLIILMVKG